MNIIHSILLKHPFYHYDKLLSLLFLIVLVYSLKIGLEAKKRGMNSWFWGLGSFLLPFIFIPVFYFKNKPSQQAKPDWVIIYTHNKIFNVKLVQDILKENDIDSVIMDKKDSNYLFGEINLYVNESQLEEAKEIILKNNL